MLLSAFRSIEQLPGAAHPAVFRVRFDCACGEEHDGLVTHEELDWAPLGLGAGEFLNLMTARLEPVGAELGELAAGHIKRGEWPWSFFCYPEEQPRPVFPSSFMLLTATDGTVGLAVRCPSCRRLSLNLVSHAACRCPVPQRPRDRGGGTPVRRGRASRRSRSSGRSSGRPRSTRAGSPSSSARLGRTSKRDSTVPLASGNGTR